MSQAVAAAKAAWGERALQDLEAEDRLSIACEKAPSSDPVISKLRAAFQARRRARCQAWRMCRSACDGIAWAQCSAPRMCVWM